MNKSVPFWLCVIIGTALALWPLWRVARPQLEKGK